MSFHNKGNMLVANEIVIDVINEMRRERKILMVLKDQADVIEYVRSDLNKYQVDNDQLDKRESTEQDLNQDHNIDDAFPADQAQSHDKSNN